VDRRSGEHGSADGVQETMPFRTA